MITPDLIAPIVFGLSGVVGFFILRLYPIWPQREQGCDAFNILMCARAIRRTWRLPPRLPPVFLLEDREQWYPPVFLALCAFVPDRWLRRRYWLFNQIVDFANAALIFSTIFTACRLIGGEGSLAAFLGASAALIYGASAGLVREFCALTTRPLGLLVLNLLIFTGWLAIQDALWWGAAIACGVLLVYAHKLSAQQAWLTLPMLAAATGDPTWLVLLPASYVGAFLLWPRGFLNLMRAHSAIVRFWSRNWPWLGAHSVRQSPVYGDNRTRTDFYDAYPKGAPITYAKECLHQNYFVIPAVLGGGQVLGGIGGEEAQALGALTPWMESFTLTLVVWIVSVYTAAAATHLIPALRGFGLGRQYVKYALAPSLVLTALLLPVGDALFQATAAGAFLLAVRQYILVFRDMRETSTAQNTGVASPELREILTRIRAMENVRLLVLPVQLCDLVAFETEHPVYWGTHGQCFDARLEAFFPVLRCRLESYAADGALTHLLLDRRYASAKELGLSDVNPQLDVGPFALYLLDRGRGDEVGAHTSLPDAADISV